MYYRCIVTSFSSNWATQINLHVFNTGTNPILQLVSENISISWTASTGKLSITRGSAMYYSNLYATSCSGGSNATSMKIYQVSILNVTNV